MPVPITIVVGELRLAAELNDSPCARDVAARLPLEIAMSRWGEEYYGSAGLEVAPAPDARTEMAIGELAVWPDGGALCIFFGPTPASRGGEPRAYSDVNPIGRLTEDPSALRSLGDSIRARFEPLE